MGNMKHYKNEDSFTARKMMPTVIFHPDLHVAKKSNRSKKNKSNRKTSKPVSLPANKSLPEYKSLGIFEIDDLATPGKNGVSLGKLRWTKQAWREFKSAKRSGSLDSKGIIYSFVLLNKNSVPVGRYVGMSGSLKGAKKRLINHLEEMKEYKDCSGALSRKQAIYKKACESHSEDADPETFYIPVIIKLVNSNPIDLHRAEYSAYWNLINTYSQKNVINVEIPIAHQGRLNQNKIPIDKLSEDQKYNMVIDYVNKRKTKDQILNSYRVSTVTLKQVLKEASIEMRKHKGKKTERIDNNLVKNSKSELSGDQLDKIQEQITKASMYRKPPPPSQTERKATAKAKDAQRKRLNNKKEKIKAKRESELRDYKLSQK